MSKELKSIKELYDLHEIPRVCDYHEIQHCDENCWTMALEAEVRRLREQLENVCNEYRRQAKQMSEQYAELENEYDRLANKL
jgi:hypothetical protein